MKQTKNNFDFNNSPFDIILSSSTFKQMYILGGDVCTTTQFQCKEGKKKNDFFYNNNIIYKNLKFIKKFKHAEYIMQMNLVCLYEMLTQQSS